jgi:N-methylhydantoinase A
VPVIEMIEIGAGGGSIARIDAMRLLKVGPDSAGSDPGPVCYGRGGRQPTVTDADLALGYLDAGFFLGGKMRLDEAAATAALERLGGQIGLDATETAAGIFAVVNANMIAAAKVHVAERGRDPRRYALVAFGGMGPMHAHAVAQGLKIREVICPASAGVLSAWGMLVASTAFEFAQSLLATLDGAALGQAREVFTRMATEGERMLREAGTPPPVIRFQRSFDMRYAGQTREITVALTGDPETITPDSVRAAFTARYEALYGHAHADIPVQLVTCRLVATSPGRSVPNQTAGARRGDATKGRRAAFFDGTFVQAAVYDRYRLGPGAAVEGPAAVEERESTALVPPGATAQVDDDLNLIIRLAERA